MEPGVQAAPERPGLVDQPVARRAVGQIGHQTRRAAAFCLHLGRNDFGAVARGPSVNDHVGAGIGQCEGHGPADSGGRAQNGCSSSA